MYYMTLYSTYIFQRERCFVSEILVLERQVINDLTVSEPESSRRKLRPDIRIHAVVIRCKPTNSVRCTFYASLNVFLCRNAIWVRSNTFSRINTQLAATS